MKHIPLTQGKVAIVDDEDYDFLMQWKWYAGKAGRRYYAVRNTRNQKMGSPPIIFMHRVIVNAPEDKDIDHKNHNALDNRKVNLRICTRSENMANVRPQTNRISQYKGVSQTGRRKQAWRSRIKHNYITIYIGYYASEIEAAKAYDKKAKELFGEFACTNF